MDSSTETPWRRPITNGFFPHCLQDAIGWHVAVLSEENAPDGTEQEKYYTGAERLESLASSILKKLKENGWKCDATSCTTILENSFKSIE